MVIYLSVNLYIVVHGSRAIVRAVERAGASLLQESLPHLGISMCAGVVRCVPLVGKKSCTVVDWGYT